MSIRKESVDILNTELFELTEIERKRKTHIRGKIKKEGWLKIKKYTKDTRRQTNLNISNEMQEEL